MNVLVLLSAVVISSCGPTSPPVAETIPHSWGHEERRYLLEGNPIFTLAGRSVILDLQTKQHYDLPSLQWPDALMSHQNLVGLSGLRFELMEETMQQDEKWMSLNIEVRRVWQGDKLLLDTTVRCEVHQLRMRRKIEDAVDGGDQSDRFFRRQKQLFPNDGKAYLLCSSGLRHFLWTCPECERIQKREYVKPAYYR